MHSQSFLQLLLHLLHAFPIIQEQETAYSVFAHSLTIFFAWFGFFLFRFPTSIICSLIFQLLSGLPFCGHLVLLQVFLLLMFNFFSCSEFPLILRRFVVVVHFGLSSRGFGFFFTFVYSRRCFVFMHACLGLFLFGHLWCRLLINLVF